MNLTEKTKFVCDCALDKKADKVTIIDVSDMTVIADKFIICSGTNKAKVRAISDHIEEQIKGKNEEVFTIDGYNEARWIIIDLGDIFVHIFLEEDREFYNLEHLWNTGENIVIYE